MIVSQQRNNKSAFQLPVRLINRLLFSFLVSILIYSCTALVNVVEEGAFQKASKQNGISSYERYLENHPDGKNSEEAKRRIDELRFERAENENTISSYEHYLENHPNGKNSEEAKRRIDELRFERAENENTISSYEHYLEKYPDGKNSEEAKRRIDELRFERAENEKTIQSYEEYLRYHPFGKFVEQASWNIALIKDTIETYENFTIKYPQSKYYSIAESKIDELYFQRASNQNTLHGYQEYLRHRPRGKYVEQAQWNITVIINTPEAYYTFIKLYPESEYSPKANYRLDELSYQITRQKNTVISYTKYLKEFTEGQFVEQAKERIFYLDTKKSASISDLINFIDYYNDNKISNVTPEEYQGILQKLEKLTKLHRSGKGYVYLYKTTKDKNYLKKAYKNRSSIDHGRYEIYLAKEYPEKFFIIKKCVASQSHSECSGKDTISCYIMYKCRATSKATVGNYLIDFKLSVPFKVETETGLIIKDKKSDTETIEQIFEIKMPALNNTLLNLQFGPIKMEERSFRKRIFRNVDGPPSHSLLDIQLIRD